MASAAGNSVLSAKSLVTGTAFSARPLANGCSAPRVMSCVMGSIASATLYATGFTRPVHRHRAQISPQNASHGLVEILTLPRMICRDLHHIRIYMLAAERDQTYSCNASDCPSYL